jgi:hypothetical protein
MPYFFFHVHDDLETVDEEGLDLPDVEAARREALLGARALACGEVMAGALHLEHHISVSDATGLTLFEIRFGDAVAIGP